jgi:hypothetical protein
MKRSPSSEGNSLLDASQEGSRIWLSLVIKLCYSQYPLLVPILGKFISVHNLAIYRLKILLILSSDLCLGLSSVFFPLGYPTVVLYAFLNGI